MRDEGESGVQAVAAASLPVARGAASSRILAMRPFV